MSICWKMCLANYCTFVLLTATVWRNVGGSLEIRKATEDLININEVFDQNGTVDIPANLSMEVPKWVDEWVAPIEMRKWFPYYVTGYDEDGSPVYVIEYGNWKFHEAVEKGEGGPEGVKALFLKYFEQGIYRIIRDGKANNTQGIGCIFDWDGFSLGNYADPTSIELRLRQFSMLQRLYSVVNYAFMVNTNFAAENFLQIVKPMVGNLLEKCEIFGPKKSQWLPKIARKIPVSQLPPWYGGKKDWKAVSVGGVRLSSLLN